MRLAPPWKLSNLCLIDAIQKYVFLTRNETNFNQLDEKFCTTSMLRTITDEVSDTLTYHKKAMNLWALHRSPLSLNTYIGKFHVPPPCSINLKHKGNDCNNICRI